MSKNSRVLKTGDNKITQSYEKHCALVDSGQAWARGVDVVKAPGTIDYITAHSDGTVIKIMTGMTNMEQDSEHMGYGNYVMILHKNNVVTLYAHLQTVMVKIGANVKAGDSIGIMGNTGRSFGDHLHFELRRYYETPQFKSLHDVRKYEWLDPTPYLNASIPFPIPATPIKPVENRYKVKVGDVQKGAYTSLDNAIKYADSINGYVFDSIENKVIYRHSVLTATSYPDYPVNSNKYYRVRKTWADSKSQVGAFSSWGNAFNCFNKNLNTHHIFDNDGKQLD